MQLCDSRGRVKGSVALVAVASSTIQSIAVACCLRLTKVKVNAVQTPPGLSDARAPRRVDGLGDPLGDPLGDSQGISYQMMSSSSCGARLCWTSLYVSDTSVGAWYVALLSILSNKAARGWLINHRILRPGAQHCIEFSATGP